MLYLYAFVVAALLPALFIPPLAGVAEKLGLVDHPNARKVHSAPMPRIGGLAIALGAATPAVLWLPWDHATISIAAGAALLLAVGLWDDRSELDYRIKFCGQGLAVGLALWPGGVLMHQVPFLAPGVAAGMVGGVLAFAFILGVTNAINLADGLDGLAGGLAFISLLGCAALAYQGQQTAVALVCAALLGGIVGFLRHNSYPARIFMGDAGSQFLGFMLGVIAITVTARQSTAYSPALPLLLLGVPIVDTLTVMTERLYRGQSPFVADRRHLHHRLLALGFRHWEAVSTVYAVQILLVGSAYLLRYAADAYVVGVFAGFFGLTLAFFYGMNACGWRLHKTRTPAQPFERRNIFLRRLQWLPAGCERTAHLGLVAVALGAAAAPDAVPLDIGRIALVLAAITGCAAFISRPGARGVRRVCTYAGILLLAYLAGQSNGGMGASWLLPVSAALLVVTMIGARVTRRDIFEMTPLDILIVCAAVLIPSLTVDLFETAAQRTALLSAVALLYACELIYRRSATVPATLTLALCGALAITGLRAIVLS